MAEAKIVLTIFLYLLHYNYRFSQETAEMARTIDIAESVYARLEALARGFDTPSDVIARLLDSFDNASRSRFSAAMLDEIESESSEDTINPAASSAAPRIFGSMAEDPLENAEIQMRISRALARKPQQEIDQFCDKQYSKQVFGLNFPLLVRLPADSDHQSRRDAVKEKGVNRWTWKFSFAKGNSIYAICTQWFRWHDDAVRIWLMENEQ